MYRTGALSLNRNFMLEAALQFNTDEVIDKYKRQNLINPVVATHENMKRRLKAD